MLTQATGLQLKIAEECLGFVRLSTSRCRFAQPQPESRAKTQEREGTANCRVGGTVCSDSLMHEDCANDKLRASILQENAPSVANSAGVVSSLGFPKILRGRAVIVRLPFAGGTRGALVTLGHLSFLMR